MLRFFVIIWLSSPIISCTASFKKPTTRLPDISTLELTEEITAQVRSEFRQQVEEDERVQRVADRLLLASADLCGRTKEDYGFYWIDASVLDRLAPIDRAIILDYHKLDEQDPFPFVSAIRQGSGAEDAGLKKGDRIVRFNNESAQPSYKGQEQGKNKFGYMAQKREWVQTLSLAVSSSLKEEKHSIPVEILRSLFKTLLLGRIA